MVLKTLLLLPVLARALTEPKHHGPGGCAEGWVDALTLGMGCLYLLQEPLTWEDAGKRCKSMGGAHLVEIDNADQLAFLQQGLSFAEGTHWTDAHYWWTAATDLTMEGDWVWSNSDFAVESSLWAPGQPDNCAYDWMAGCVADENCGALRNTANNGGQTGWDGADYKMMDLQCDIDTVTGHHTPSFTIFSVCQIKQFADQ